MRGRSSDYDRASPLAHDVEILDTVRECIRVRQIQGPANELRVTVSADSWRTDAWAPVPMLFLRGDRLQAAELLEQCARALRSLQ